MTEILHLPVSRPTSHHAESQCNGERVLRQTQASRILTRIYTSLLLFVLLQQAIGKVQRSRLQAARVHSEASHSSETSDLLLLASEPPLLAFEGRVST